MDTIARLLIRGGWAIVGERSIYKMAEGSHFSVLNKRGVIVGTAFLLLCALLLGLRRGEIVALKWSDIDIRSHSLSVNKSVYKEKGAPQQLKPPKSQTSIRTVYFSDVLVDAIAEWKTTQAEERASAGFNWKEQDFIFTNAVGDMISLYTPSRICSKFEEKNGLAAICAKSAKESVVRCNILKVYAAPHTNNKESSI